MGNLPTLYENSLAQYESETAKKAWLWFAENHDRARMKYAADEYANEVSRLTEITDFALPAGFGVWHDQQPHLDPRDEVMTDLTRFILKRHANYRMGGNVSMWWEGH